MNIFVSVLTYELGKALGIEDATLEFRRQVDDPKSPENLPAARVVARLRELGSVMLYHGAGTCLPKARSRAAHAALSWLREQDESQRAIWVMVDDDVECDARTLRTLLAAAAADRVAVLPCPIRGNAAEQHTLNLAWESSLLLQSEGVTVRPVKRAGCGMMVVPLAALQRVSDDERADWWHDDDDQPKRALFQQLFAPRSDDDQRLAWLGEDYSFCERLRASGVSIVGIVDGVAIHDGQALDLKLCQR